MNALTIQDVTHRSGIGRTKVFAEIAAGRLAARKCGRRTLILAEDFAAWLASLPAVAPAENGGR